MANEVTLKAQPRQGTGRITTSKIKRLGAVPAVLYGHGDPETLQVSAHELGMALKHSVGEHFLVALDVEGQKSAQHAMIQEVQHHAVTGAIRHVDFLRVRMNEKINSTVPIEPIGEATGVKTGGGILEQNMHELEIECLPKDLPELIKVDVSALKVGDSILVQDLTLPGGVEALSDAEIPVFVVAEPNVVEEEPEAAATSPEVIKEKPAGESKA